MESLLAVLIGLLFAAAVYLLLRPNLLRVLFGVIVLSNAVNLIIFTAGRVAAGATPPLITEGAYVPEPLAANPLPQALVLTAIVIGFGLAAFALVLALKTYGALGTLSADEVDRARTDEPSPFVDGPDEPSPPPPDAQPHA